MGKSSTKQWKSGGQGKHIDQPCQYRHLVNKWNRKKVIFENCVTRLRRGATWKCKPKGRIVDNAIAEGKYAMDAATLKGRCTHMPDPLHKSNAL